MSSRLYVVCLIAVWSCLPRIGSAATNVLFILDNSGSMLERVDGAPKIVAAKRVLADTLRDLPREAKVGLMTYGHRRRHDCDDIELLAPIGEQQRAAITQKVNRLQPKGETPIAGALDRAAGAFANFKGDHNMVVLVTDGAEECHGDPCAAAQRLAAQGLDVQVNVVGFNLAARERDAVECVAREGHGHYYDARDQASLVLALSEVRQEVQQAQATPPPTSAPLLPPASGLSASPAQSRTNLLSAQNGGQVLVAPSESWNHVAKNDEKHFYDITSSGCEIASEVVLAFRDEAPATFDRFEMFIPESSGSNIKEFELLVGDEGPAGNFRSAGQFTTTNARMMRSPYQGFQFPEVTARYLKVRILSTWARCVPIRLMPWRVIGRAP